MLRRSRTTSDHSASTASDRQPRPAAIPRGSDQRSVDHRCQAGPSCTSRPITAHLHQPRPHRRGRRVDCHRHPPALTARDQVGARERRDNLLTSPAQRQNAARGDRETRRRAVQWLPARGELSSGIRLSRARARPAVSRLAPAAPEREVRERSKEVDQAEQPPARLRPTNGMDVLPFTGGIAERQRRCAKRQRQGSGSWGWRSRGPAVLVRLERRPGLHRAGRPPPGGSSSEPRGAPAEVMLVAVGSRRSAFSGS
jgi:hypothetical protein